MDHDPASPDPTRHRNLVGTGLVVVGLSYVVIVTLGEALYYGLDDHFCSSGGTVWRLTPTSRVMGHMLAFALMGGGSLAFAWARGSRRAMGGALIALGLSTLPLNYRMAGAGCWTEGRIEDTTVFGLVTFWSSESCPLLHDGLDSSSEETILGADSSTARCQAEALRRLPVRRLGIWSLDLRDVVLPLPTSGDY